MFKNVTPESIGVSSVLLLDLIKKFESQKLAFHSIIAAKGEDVFFKAFWEPFNENSFHRMYSVTKSFVGIAVCELAAKGDIDLKQPIISYFGDVLPDRVPEELKKQTVEDMLTMRTCMKDNYWFDESVTDRLKYYFLCTPKKESGTEFDYDSDASFVLGCLVERITGKSLLSYLKEICLGEIGFSDSAYTLKTPGGHTWADSSLICKTEDVLKFGRLLANKGVWNGRQILNRDMVIAATKQQTDTNNETTDYLKFGYGYQIWMNGRNGFSFIGMHGQYMHYDPETDVIFVCTSGNKAGNASQLIYDGFEQIVKNCHEKLPENQSAFKSLMDTVNSLKLLSLDGTKYSNKEKEINDMLFKMEDNPMGIKYMSFSFSEDKILWKYENKQGKKELPFGRAENIFSVFPQSGYSRDIGNVPSPDNKYKCAASAVWKAEHILACKVQIIDDYIGILDIDFDFSGGIVQMTAQKDAEDFLKEYNGYAEGKANDFNE